MLEEIQRLTQAEAQAAQCKADAEEAAKRMRVQAEEDGQAALEQARQQAREETRALLQQAQERAAQEARRLHQEGEKDCDALRRTAESRLAQAAEEIRERIVRELWQL